MLRLFVASVALVGLLFLPLDQVHAQVLPVELGLKGGFNMTTAANNGDFESRALSGAAGGLSIGVPVAQSWVLQTEVTFNRRGVRNEADDIDFKVGYIDVPLFLRRDIGGAELLTFYVFGGPSIAFRVSESFETVQDLTQPNQQAPEPTPGTPPDAPESAFAAQDIGLNLGFGGMLDVLFSDLLMEVRFYAGLADNDRSGTPLRNRGVTVMAGFRF